MESARTIRHFESTKGPTPYVIGNGFKMQITCQHFTRLRQDAPCGSTGSFTALGVPIVE